MGPNLAVLAVFSTLSVLAVGGGAAVLPEMKEIVVASRGWLTDDQFRDIYGLGQMAPGPNMLMVLLIGYHVTGLPGALMAFAGFFAPASVLAVFCSRLWERFAASPWRGALQAGMAPVIVGLMAAGVVAIGRTAIDGAPTLALALAACLGVAFLKRVNPALIVLAGGLIGLLAFSGAGMR